MTEYIENFVGPLRAVHLYGGLYVLYENGQIYCPPRKVNAARGSRLLRDRYLKHRKDSNGYLYVTLYDEDGVSRVQRIHRLLMLTFKYQEGCESLVVNHIDSNKANNALYNLEWCNHRENAIHALRNGNRGQKYDYDTRVEAVKILREVGWSNAKISRAFGTTPETIGSVLKTNDIPKSQKGRNGGKIQEAPTMS